MVLPLKNSSSVCAGAAGITAAASSAPPAASRMIDDAVRCRADIGFLFDLIKAVVVPYDRDNPDKLQAMSVPDVTTVDLKPRLIGSGNLGVEITSLQASRATAADVKTLMQLLAKHGVIALRDQELQPKEYVAFA